MSDLVDQWIAKAEGDYATASREFSAESNLNFDAVCYHAQQCAEKYFKALMIHLGVQPPRVHDLAYLHRLLAPVCTEWRWDLDELRLLSHAAVVFRYPGETAEIAEAQAAYDICHRLRERLREVLECND